MAFTEYYVADDAGGGGVGSEGDPFTFAEGVAAMGPSISVNVLKGAYSSGAVTVGLAGTSQGCGRLRGYNATIGDLVGARVDGTGKLDLTNYPVITLTGIFNPLIYTQLESLSFEGALASHLVGNGGVDVVGYIHCSFVNTLNNASARCAIGDNYHDFINCDLECSGASHGIMFDSDNEPRFIGCQFRPNANGAVSYGLGGTFIDNVFYMPSGQIAINIQNNGFDGNLFYGNTIHDADTAIKLGNNPTGSFVVLVINNHITDCSKFIDSAYVATANNSVVEVNNRTRDNTTPRTGLSDFPISGEITADTGGPETDYVNPPTDLHLLTTAAGAGAALDGVGNVGAYTGFGVPDFPEVENVLTIDTVNDVQGTFDEAARNTDPGEANVLDSTGYLIQNASKTGTYSPDFPAVGNVTEDDTVDNVQGTYHEATTAEVQDSVTFGASSSLTGTYTGEVSAAPTGFAIADSGDGVNWTISATAPAGTIIPIRNAAGVEIAIIDADVGSATTCNLTAGQTYTPYAVETGKLISVAGSTAVAPILVVPGSAAAGTLSIESNWPDNLSLRYTPGENFDSGVLNIYRVDTGVSTSQAVVSGTNTLTNLSQGRQYTFTVDAYNAGGTYGDTTSPVSLVTAANIDGNDSAIEFKYRTDSLDWQTLYIGSDTERIHIPVDCRGHWYQQKISCKKQNVRLRFNGMKIHALSHGRGENITSG